MKCLPAMVRVLIALLVAPIVHAEKAPTAPELVQAEIRFYLWHNVGSVLWTEKGDAPAAVQNAARMAEFYISRDREYNEVRCAPQSYSEPVTYAGARRFQIFRKETASGGVVTFVPVAETLLPTGSGRYVVYLDANLKTLRMMVFPFGSTAVAKGQMLVFNATDRPLGVRVGNVKNVLSPDASLVFPVSSFTDYQMPIEIFERIQEQWQPKVTTRRAVRFDERNLGVLYQRTEDQEISFTLLPPVMWEDKPK